MTVLSAGIVVVRPSGGGYEYLLLQNNRYVDFPKGKVDEGESLLEAALRETQEESHLYDLDFKWGTDVYTETDPYLTKSNDKKVKKVARYYVAELKSGEVKLLPNPHSGIIEHDKFYWVTYEKALELPLSERIRLVLDWAYKVTKG